MRSNTRKHAIVALALFLGGGSGMVACGGAKPNPNTYSTQMPTGPTATASPTAAASTGGQTAVTDAPSDGEPDAFPKLSAAARGPYDRGMALWQAGDLGGAKQAFTDATNADSNAFQAFYSLGVIQERLKDPGALQSYRQAYTLQPQYEPAIVAYGQLLAKNGSLSEADSFLSGKRTSMPKSAAVLAALAEVKSLNKDTGNAQSLAQEALKLNPDYRPAMVVLARDHYRNRRIDLALYALKAILDGNGDNNPARDKNNAEAHLLRAVIYKEKGLRQAAIDEFKTVISLRPDLVEARVQLAGYYLQSGNADDAVPLLELALKFNKDNLPAHLNLGDAYRIQGRTEEAKRELEWVVARDANVPQAYYSLGLLYLFAPSVQGMDPKAQLAQSIASLEKFQALRGKGTQASQDDSDQLLIRAKAKQDANDAQDKANAAASAAAASAAANPPPPPAASSSGAPAGSAAP
jgi:Tfp pilus assembly protein PilF